VNDKNKNLLLRLGTAAVLLPLILWLIGKGGFFSAGLMGWASAVVAGEYYVITMKKLSPVAFVGIAVAAALPVFPAWLPAHAGDLAFWSVGAFAIVAWSVNLMKDPLPDGPMRAAHLVTGLLYGGVGLTALSAVRLTAEGLGWVVCALVITWANDTCAYFAGRFLGKHKLYPLVSPNKTWEGFFGGMAGSVGGLFITKLVYFHALTPLDCVLVGLAGGMLGPLGDLSESMLKRAYNVKDSGKIIPGHGGLLDRIDALLFNAPMVFVYVQFLRPVL
jgi:phosphatidate cytidylyltransferase